MSFIKNNLVELNNNLSVLGNQIIGRLVEINCLVTEEDSQFKNIDDDDFESDSGLGGINLYIDFKEGNIMDNKIKKTGTVISGCFKISLKEGFVSWYDVYNIIDFGLCYFGDHNGVSVGELKVVEDENEVGKFCIKSFITLN